jgi:hypothetical protein
MSEQLCTVGFRAIVQLQPGIAGNLASSEPQQGPKTLNTNLRTTSLQKTKIDAPTGQHRQKPDSSTRTGVILP